MADLSAYLAKLPSYLNQSFDVGDPRQRYMEHLIEHGFEPPRVLDIGNIQRMKAPGDKGKKQSGWSVYYEFSDSMQEGVSIGVGVFGNWRGEPEKSVWISRSQNAMTGEERAAYLSMIESARIAREKEQAVIWEETAKKCLEIYQAATPISADHPYIVKKGIIPLSPAKLSRESLVLPVFVDGSLASLQFIKPDGEKIFKKGGRVKAGYCRIEGSEKTIFVAEGYATAASVAMATGCAVYIAFNAGNLYEITAMAKAKHPGSIVAIAADDDIGSGDNAGRTKAMQAGDALGVPVYFPDCGGVKCDFNDMHARFGIDSVRSILLPDAPKAFVTKHDDEKCAEPPPGFLRDVFDYYNATSGNYQRGFATQTALAVASTVLSRSYKTNKENFPSLYFLNVGKSSTGKEHAKTVCEKILNDCGLGDLVAGDGYTSAGAVFSTLMRKPRHISIIDEFGRYLEASSNTKFGNFNQREANTKLMESIGRAHTIMRPPNYSTMTLKRKDAENIEGRFVHNPAITILSMTTPDTFFRTLDIGSVKDGFINRFIISISDAKRTVRVHKDPLPVPDSIMKWVISVTERAGLSHIASDPPNPKILSFDVGAIELQEQFQLYCIEKANELDAFGMAELTGRANEMAMRVALIVALSRDYSADIITERDMAWAIEYIKNGMDRTIARLKMTISSSDFERHKKEILQSLRDVSPGWIRFSTMQKRMPFAQHQRKYLIEILESLCDAELADVRAAEITGRGRPTKEYRACE